MKFWSPSETGRHIQIFVSLGLALGDIVLLKILYLGLSVRTNSSVISRPTSHLQIWLFNVIRQMPIRHLNRVEQFLDKAKSEVTIVVMGIAYRSEVDDTRNSASKFSTQGSCQARNAIAGP